MAKMPRERVPLAEFRNNMSKYINKATQKGCVIQITKHGQDSVIAITVEDLRRIEALIEMLSKRTQEALEQKEAGYPDKARRARKENEQIGELVKKALRQAATGDSKLLHEMARKYLGL